jgi:hypothetical protein
VPCGPMLDELTWTLTVYSAGFGPPAAQANAEKNRIAIVIFVTEFLVSVRE